MAIGAIAGDNDRLGVPPYDEIVWQDDGVAYHVSDMLHDAIVEFRRLRGELPPKAGRSPMPRRSGTAPARRYR
jgi:hypothetical protein